MGVLGLDLGRIKRINDFTEYLFIFLCYFSTWTSLVAFENGDCLWILILTIREF